MFVWHYAFYACDPSERESLDQISRLTKHGFFWILQIKKTIKKRNEENINLRFYFARSAETIFVRKPYYFAPSAEIFFFLKALLFLAQQGRGALANPELGLRL